MKHFSFPALMHLSSANAKQSPWVEPSWKISVSSLFNLLKLWLMSVARGGWMPWPEFGSGSSLCLF
jgi:hypothetical protein